LLVCFAAEREGAESVTFLSLGFFSVTLIFGFSENFSLAIILSFFAIVVRATRRPPLCTISQTRVCRSLFDLDDIALVVGRKFDGRPDRCHLRFDAVFLHPIELR
jgi:hypothetical protein